jgi:uracil-DNA glycosylase
MSDAAVGEDRLKLDPSWKRQVGPFFERPEMKALGEFLRDEKRRGKTIYPAGADIFAALNATPFDAVEVVILGQDPYHGPNQAHGFCFSVKPGVRPPPSLENIFKEMARDVGVDRPDHGCLTAWAERGVLLLNAVLTVEKGLAGSHAGKGWEGFTDACIDALNREREHLVFMLWGAYAQKKGMLIDRQRHLVLKAPHPSPLARGGFDGSGHFSKANEYLRKHGKTPIDWRLPSLAEISGLGSRP